MPLSKATSLTKHLHLKHLHKAKERQHFVILRKKQKLERHKINALWNSRPYFLSPIERNKFSFKDHGNTIKIDTLRFVFICLFFEELISSEWF